MLPQDVDGQTEVEFGRPASIRQSFRSETVEHR
jgi:hypothetical protein